MENPSTPTGGCVAGSFVITRERFDRDERGLIGTRFAIGLGVRDLGLRSGDEFSAVRLVARSLSGSGGAVFGFDGSFLQLLDGRTGERVTLRRTRCD